MAKDEFFDLFVQELAAMKSGEDQIVKALPKMINATQYPELKEAFQHHLDETKEQVSRLTKVFSILGVNPDIVTCEAMKGLIGAGEKVINGPFHSFVKDAALIAVAQKIEHHEIASYGTLITFAEQLEFSEVAELLKDSISEEKNADKTLSKLAKGGFFTSGINKKAEDSRR